MQPDQNQTTSPEPAPDQPVSLPTPVSALPPANGANRRRGVIFIIAASVIAVLLISTVAVYALWFNNPNKVLADALGGLLKTQTVSLKGMAMSQTGKDPASMATFSFVQQNSSRFQIDATVGEQVGSQSLKVGGTLVEDNTTAYVKVSGIKDIVQAAAASSGSDVATVIGLYGGLLDKIDGKWVSISQNDFDQLAKLAPETPAPKQDAMTCVQNAASAFRASSAQQNQVTSAYQKNQFINITKTLENQTVNGHPSNHYLLAVDDAKSQAFGKALESTDYFKAINNCVGGTLGTTAPSVADTPTQPTTPAPTVEVWIDQWSHQLTRIKISGKDGDTTSTVDLSIELNKTQPVTVPKADTTMTQLINDLQQSFMNSLDSSSF